MLKKYRVLVLTDHSGHSDQNSIYAIVNKMNEHLQCASIHIGSRGLPENQEFFQNQKEEKLYISQINENFAFSEDGQYYKYQLRAASTDEFDIVLLRLPRPIEDSFLIWLEKIFARAIILNRPSGIIATSTKAFLLNFPNACPPIKLCKSVDEVLAFAETQPIVLKPLREYGGKGILKINGEVLDDGTSVFDTTKYLQEIENLIEQDGYLAMKFLKNVNQGDKRILVVGGEIMASSLRLPAEDSWLCNVAQGGTSVPTEVTDAEIKIIEEITPLLLENGIFIFGADTLVDDNGERVLSEINTLSIGGFPQAQEQTGRPIISQTINKIFKYADSRTR